MNPLQHAKDRLEGKNLSEVARRAGMAYRTVLVIANGNAEDMYVKTYTRLMDVLDGMEAEQCNSETTK